MGVCSDMIYFSFEWKNKISKFFMNYDFHFENEKSMLCVLWDDADARKTGKLIPVSNLDINVIHWYDPILKLHSKYLDICNWKMKFERIVIIMFNEKWYYLKRFESKVLWTTHAISVWYGVGHVNIYVIFLKFLQTNN